MEAEAGNGSGGSGKFSWKRKLEAVKFNTLPAWPIVSNVKNLNVGQFFVKYSTKSECLIDHYLQTKNFEGLWFT